MSEERDTKRVSTTVYIAGQPYTLSGNQSEERVHRVALYVDQQMSRLRNVRRYNERMITVLAALNLADELFTERETNEALRQEIRELRRRQPELPPPPEAEPDPVPTQPAPVKAPGLYARRLADKEKGKTD